MNKTAYCINNMFLSFDIQAQIDVFTNLWCFLFKNSLITMFVQLRCKEFVKVITLNLTLRHQKERGKVTGCKHVTQTHTHTKKTFFQYIKL